MKIIIYPNQILETKAEKIKNPLDPKIQKLIKEMRKVMKENNGIGLAAPQIGQSIRLCIIESDDIFLTLINPKITAHSNETEVAEEGCLSFPDKFLPIERFSSVQVRYLNEQGKRCKIKAGGLLSRTLQHEIDHLNGIVFINK